MPAGSCPKACEAFLAHADLLDQVHQGTMYRATTSPIDEEMKCMGALPSTVTTQQKTQDNWQACHQFAEDHCFRKPFDAAGHGHGDHHSEGARSVSGQLPAGEVKPKKATKQQLQVLRDLVDGPANEAMVASSVKLAKGGTIHAHDVVVFHH